MIKTLPLALAALAASLSALSGSMSASSTNTVSVPPVVATTTAPFSFDPAANASDNWAGYLSETGTYTEIGASWKVPTAHATGSFATDAAWIGIGGVSGRDLIQAGTETIVENGTVEYDAWYETLPDVQQPIPLAISAGDSVSVSLKETEGDVWHLTFTNTSTGKNYETDITYASSKSSAEWIEERPLVLQGRAAGYAPLDSFGSVQFSDAYAVKDGTRTSLSNLSPEPVSMIDNSLTALAAPSAVSDGSFTVSESPEALSQSSAQSVYAAAPRRHRSRRAGGSAADFMVISYGF